MSVQSGMLIMSGVNCGLWSLESEVIEALGHQMSGLIRSVKWILSGVSRELNCDPGLAPDHPSLTLDQVWEFCTLLV